MDDARNVGRRIVAAIRRFRQLRGDFLMANDRLDRATDQLGVAMYGAESGIDRMAAGEVTTSVRHAQEELEVAAAASTASADRLAVFLMEYDLRGIGTEANFLHHLRQLHAADDPRLVLRYDRSYSAAQRLDPRLSSYLSWTNLHAALQRLDTFGNDPSTVLRLITDGHPLPDADPGEELLWRLYINFPTALPPT